jgi:fatty-acyl-CoA synthase
MLGQMMDVPLSISNLLVHADRFHGDTEIVSRRVEGDIHRYTYRDAHRRSRQAASALQGLGIAPGGRVATLAWNGYRHFELYYGISGSGRVMHTINPRLHPEQVAWIANDAEDEALFFDLSFAPLIDAVAPHCPKIKHWIALCDEDRLPALKTVKPIAYETWLAGGSADPAWPVLDENAAACLCYTSGTTGNPKGVLYSHRSTVLHALGSIMPDVMGLKATDVVLPVVPMFHVNAWGTAYSCPIVGAKLVFPGSGLDGKSLIELFEAEKVTFTAGVPTIWLGLLQELQKTGQKLSTVNRMVVGGSACPPALMKAFKDDYGIHIHHAWGMTEMSPLGTFNALKGKHLSLSDDEQFKIHVKAGRPVFGVDIKIVDDAGKELPWDGVAFGDLLVRGPWIVKQYYRRDESPLVDGWFPTGDVATIDPDGYVQITDRSKDVIKSGGEWISSIDLENIAVSHPAVAEAGAIGVFHPKWDERPLVVVVLKEGKSATAEEILAHYEGKIAKWQIPDDVQFVDELPHTATGKISKLKLREQFKDYVLPTAGEALAGR